MKSRRLFITHYISTGYLRKYILIQINLVKTLTAFDSLCQKALSTRMTIRLPLNKVQKTFSNIEVLYRTILETVMGHSKKRTTVH
jgi:hypothetical protein